VVTTKSHRDAIMLSVPGSSCPNGPSETSIEKSGASDGDTSWSETTSNPSSSVTSAQHRSVSGGRSRPSGVTNVPVFAAPVGPGGQVWNGLPGIATAVSIASTTVAGAPGRATGRTTCGMLTRRPPHIGTIVSGPDHRIRASNAYIFFVWPGRRVAPQNGPSHGGSLRQSSSPFATRNRSVPNPYTLTLWFVRFVTRNRTRVSYPGWSSRSGKTASHRTVPV
jgi:hypothetical protein